LKAPAPEQILELANSHLETHSDVSTLWLGSKLGIHPAEAYRALANKDDWQCIGNMRWRKLETT
jgi:hypothetical protein